MSLLLNMLSRLVITFLPRSKHLLISWLQAAIGPSNSTTGYIYHEKTIVQKDTCTPMFIAAVFTRARTGRPPRRPSADEWIKKWWYIYTMEYYSAIKRMNLSHWTEVDEPRACYTKWSKLEKQILYMNTYIWNLEKWYYWTYYLQGRNRDTDTENRLVDIAGERKDGISWEEHWNIYITICKIDSQWKVAA